MTPLELAFLSLSRRRVASLITMMSIALSVACSGILLRLYHLSSSRFDSIASGWEAVVGAKAGGIEILLNSLNGEGPYPEFLPFVLFQSLQAQQAVQFEDGQSVKPNYLKTIVPFLYFAKLGQNRIVGTDENFIHSLKFREGHWVGAPGEVVAGDAVDAHLGDTVNAQPWVADHLGEATLPLKVVGILERTNSVWDRTLFASVEAAQTVVAAQRAYLGERTIWGTKVLNYFLINLNPGGIVPLENLVNKRTVGQVVRVDEEKQKLEDLTGVGKSLGIFVSIFVLLLTCLSVSSMLITRFEAMTVQLAVLRAIGYVRREIGLWLIWEGFLLGTSGCAIGGLVDALGFPWLRGLLGSALPPPEIVTSSLSESLPVWLLTIAATILAIFVPLIRLYRQDVHQALKG